MREDWEVRKLGDVCNFSQGIQVDLPSQSTEQKENRNRFLRITDYTIGDIDKRFVDIQDLKYYVYPDDIVIVRYGASAGFVGINKEGILANNLFKLNHDKTILNYKFLYYCLSTDYYKRFIQKLAFGAAMPALSFSTFKDFNIPVPPLQTQHRIVEELDCLTSIIEKQKKQLEEPDNLAQAIFYDMFGDPIENEKGWKNEILINLCTKITDGTHDTPLKLTEGIKFITGKHIRKGCIDYDHSDYVDIQTHVEIFKRCNPEYGDILYTNIGANLGTAAINKVHYEFSMKNVSLLKINKNLLSSYFLEFILNNDRKKLQIIRDFSKGGAQKFLSLNSISNIKIPLPPLPLQQQFASKIEAIEKQKELIKKSIKETEDLFNSRMDYYFN